MLATLKNVSSGENEIEVRSSLQLSYLACWRDSGGQKLSSALSGLRKVCFCAAGLIITALPPTGSAGVYNLYVPGSATVEADGWRAGTQEPISGWRGNSDSVTWISMFSASEPATDGAGTGKPNLNFIGDPSNPSGYYAFAGNYVLFRMRVNQTTIDNATFTASDRGTYFVLVDRIDLNGTGTPDYGFAWDAQNYSAPDTHGLEMTYYKTGTEWRNLVMDDVDGTQQNKLATDINGLDGAGRAYEGYVRGVTGAGGTGGFIDIAVAWSYLTGSDSGIVDANRLKPGQTWNIAVAAISGANDNNGLSQNTTDVMGVDGQTTQPLNYAGTWSGPIVTAVPEPANVALGLFGSLSLVVVAARRRQQMQERLRQWRAAFAQWLDVA